MSGSLWGTSLSHFVEVTPVPESLGFSSWAAQIPISGCSVSCPEEDDLAGSVLKAECGKRAGCVCLFTITRHSLNLLSLLPFPPPSAGPAPRRP